MVIVDYDIGAGVWLQNRSSPQCDLALRALDNQYPVQILSVLHKNPGWFRLIISAFLDGDRLIYIKFCRW